HAWPAPDGGWEVTTHAEHNAEPELTQRYGALIVATGHDWDSNFPEAATTFSGRVLHSHDYRTPEPFRAQRVLVIGAGNSASEIAVELAPVAARVFWSFRRSAHVV